jgi:two-component system, NarL family, sensor kinase
MKPAPVLFIPIFIGLLLFCNSQGISQVKNTDSLNRVIAGQPENTARVDNLILLCRSYFLTNKLDSAVVRSEEALRLSQKLKYKGGEGDAYYIKSSVLRARSELKASLAMADRYMEIYQNLQDSVRLEKGYYNLGLLYNNLADYDLAVYYSQKCLSFSIPLKDYTISISSFNNLGKIYSDGYTKYDSAAHYYLKALEVIEESGNTAPLGTILVNLGDVYFSDKQYQIAGNYFQKSLALSLENGNVKNQASIYMNLGRVACKKGLYQDAMDYYGKSLSIYSALGDEKGKADVNNNYGDAYFWQKKYDKALVYFNKALAYYSNKGYDKGIILTKLNIAAVYSESGQLDKSQRIQDSCLALAESSGNPYLILQAIKNVADNYKKSGDYQKAYRKILEYNDLNDSIFNIERSKAISALILKYEKGKDQTRILELEKENLQKTNQRNAFMFTIIGILVITLFLLVYFRQKSRHEKIVANQKIRQLEEEKKLMAAKLLVEGQEEERKRIATELHDGLGVLLSATKMQFSVIKDKSPENREIIEKASKMLEQASGDVRKISHNMMPGLLTKLGFYEAVEDLFENLDENKNLHATCTITGDQDQRLAENKEIMLYRIVQEMVNNTLKHAEAGLITIDISILQDSIELLYSDDGKGFDYNSKMNNGSIGLKSISSRVSFLNGTLSVDTKPGHCVRYSIRIPS